MFRGSKVELLQILYCPNKILSLNYFFCDKSEFKLILIRENDLFFEFQQSKSIKIIRIAINDENKTILKSITVYLFIAHHGHIVQTVKVRQGLQIGLVFNQLLSSSKQIDINHIQIDRQVLYSISLSVPLDRQISYDKKQ